jgi:nitrite reductase/ring-hydroxylating ferredoxin subunit
MTDDFRHVPLCRSDEVEEGASHQVVLAGRKPLVVFRLDGAFHVLDDTCTHGNAFLSEGDIDGCRVYCPFHSGAFDIRTGAATVAPCVKPVRTYPAVVVDGVVHADLGER